MHLQDKIKPYLKHIKLFTVVSGGVTIGYNLINNTYKHIGRIVNTDVLDGEKKNAAAYIYIDDPLYNTSLVKEIEKESQQSTFLIWRKLKPPLIWRLFLICRYGNPDQRDVALEQLATFRNNKDWDCLKLAQALDMKNAVLLARTRGADLRYFLPPPMHVRRAAKSKELICFKFRDLLVTLHGQRPHICIEHFLSKYFINVHENAIEADSIPSKPDRLTDREISLLCLKALYHHLSIIGYEDISESLPAFIGTELLPCIAELLLRNPNDSEIDSAVLRLLTIVSVDRSLLVNFFQNGLIRELSRLIRSNEVSLSSSAAVCLSNLSGECCYQPGLFLLYPIYRTTTISTCDTLLVHGLRGGVFVTWRQRDRSCAKVVGIADINGDNDNDCDPCTEQPEDPQFRKIVEDVIDTQAMLANMEVVLQDLPENAVRESQGIDSYVTHKKRMALIQEEYDRCHYTNCWPKEWLPKDCKNLRILGVNYWSSISEWLERCPLQMADIESRANELSSALFQAGVGTKDTPVVWLTHSMGGLIVKQLLVASASSENVEEKKLVKNTKAVLFFSTPHKGSPVATMPRAAAAVFWPSNDVRQLSESSPFLHKLHNDFLKIADEHGWETISFSETKPTLVTAFKVPFHLVKPESADLGRGAFYELPLDHLSICKPASRQSLIYKTVLDVLQRATKDNNEPIGTERTTLSLLDTHFLNILYKLKTVVNDLIEIIARNFFGNL